MSSLIDVRKKDREPEKDKMGAGESEAILFIA